MTEKTYELRLLGLTRQLPLRRVAAVDERFASQLQGYRPTQLIPDSTVGADPAVELLDYQPAVAR